MKEIKKFHISRSNSRGFTLIELLIVIGIIAVLAAATFVALNPLTRFQDARDARRRTDVSAILSAIKVDQIDRGGEYLPSIEPPATTAGTPYMIATTATSIGCDLACTDVSGIAAANCIDLSGLVSGGYLGSVPIAPTGYTAPYTGYTLTRSATGIITVQACDPENTASISASR